MVSIDERAGQHVDTCPRTTRSGKTIVTCQTLSNAEHVLASWIIRQFATITMVHRCFPHLNSGQTRVVLEPACSDTVTAQYSWLMLQAINSIMCLEHPHQVTGSAVQRQQLRPLPLISAAAGRSLTHHVAGHLSNIRKRHPQKVQEQFLESLSL